MSASPINRNQQVDASGEHNPALVDNIIKRRNEVFDKNDVRDVTLFIAHVTYDRSIRSLSSQIGWPMKKIRRSVNYVRNQLESSLEDIR